MDDPRLLIPPALLEAAESPDPLWNAAPQLLIQDGKIHFYMWWELHWNFYLLASTLLIQLIPFSFSAARLSVHAIIYAFLFLVACVIQGKKSLCNKMHSLLFFRGSWILRGLLHQPRLHPHGFLPAAGGQGGAWDTQDALCRQRHYPGAGGYSFVASQPVVENWNLFSAIKMSGKSSVL